MKMQRRLKEGYESMAQHPALSDVRMMARFKAMCTAGGKLRCGKSRLPIITVNDEQQAILNEFTQDTCQDLINPE